MDTMDTAESSLNTILEIQLGRDIRFETLETLRKFLGSVQLDNEKLSILEKETHLEWTDGDYHITVDVIKDEKTEKPYQLLIERAKE
jgi:hypothetical protein